MRIDNQKEDAYIIKPTGQKYGPHKAIFSRSAIMVMDTQADIEEGDIISRTLPNGKDEQSHVTKSTFYKATGSKIGPHYQVEFNSGKATVENSPVQNFNISNAQSIQIGDHNSQTIINSFTEIVRKIEDSDVSLEEKREAKNILKTFLNHPATISVLGAVAGSLIS